MTTFTFKFNDSTFLKAYTLMSRQKDIGWSCSENWNKIMINSNLPNEIVQPYIDQLTGLANSVKKEENI